ncbi:hypothetical protein [Bosea sp. UNC402CLCol]|uniref:phage baseplate plug family protein n=1 Tax=Bosea sp. UNC402CLCol TaxID=1510531 RepID=UPI000571AE4E|nr:hypothetical protein [Bosea sp. UNC402CLCol]
MATVYEFPLLPQAQQMSITLGTVEYQVRFGWCDTPDGGWFIDIADIDGNPLVQGLPLTAGENVLQQFDYLGFPGEIRVMTDSSELVEPTYANLGTNGKVLFISP